MHCSTRKQLYRSLRKLMGRLPNVNVSAIRWSRYLIGRRSWFSQPRGSLFPKTSRRQAQRVEKETERVIPFTSATASLVARSSRGVVGGYSRRTRESVNRFKNVEYPVNLMFPANSLVTVSSTYEARRRRRAAGIRNGREETAVVAGLLARRLVYYSRVVCRDRLQSERKRRPLSKMWVCAPPGHEKKPRTRLRRRLCISGDYNRKSSGRIKCRLEYTSALT